MHPSFVAIALIILFFVTIERKRKDHTARSVKAGEYDCFSTRLIGISIMTTWLMIALGLILNRYRIAQMPYASIVGWSGVVLMVGGLLLRHWAGQILGEFFTRTLLVREEQRVVQKGPYRYIRHPGYVGALMLWLGALLSTACWIAIGVAGIVVVGAYLYRVKVEEEMLVTTLGDEYRAYQGRTCRLIPFIY
jgi:protein-S-isoprenylcysteine O-methyltransferase Ste14